MAASPRPPAHVTLLKPVDVPECLITGEKFVKWEEDSGIGTPVTVRVDKNGLYLYWIDQNKEMDMLDFAVIRDARTGKHSKVPRDPKLRSVVTLGSQDTLEEKTISVCYGSDFVNLTFINFCCTRKDIAQMWTDELVKLAYNINQMNLSTTMFLQKAYTKLSLASDKISIKNLTKMLAQNKDDKKRVEKALEAAELPSGKNDYLPIDQFTFEEFFNFYKHLTSRTEVEKIFEELCGPSGKKKYLTAERFVEFLNKTQRDPRLNEILHPYANPDRAKDLIEQYEPVKSTAQKGCFSLDGFLRYLMSGDNPIMAASSFDCSHDMEQPLSHYFINSSHNTYLIGHQLTGKSSVEIYRQCLLAGCRCVELDFWNGRTEEPVIVHGYTFVPEINAKEVIEAIADSAFKTSDFPVVLSFENHCNPRQQAKIAQYCREIFGDMLLDLPLESHPIEPGFLLPSPALLRRKIIIKNKKKHHHHHRRVHATSRSNTIDNMAAEVTGNGDIPHPPMLQQRQGSKESQEDENEEEEDDEEGTPSSSGGEEEDDPVEDLKIDSKNAAEKAREAAAAKETEAGAEISALVNYIQPVHFQSFETAKEKKRFYEMSSFDEKQATTLLKEMPIEFVNYNKKQLSRVYPSGKRFDSSNFMPQVFWNAGCQLVALNYQTLDLAMQLNLGIFEYNARCGYLLKPEFMRRLDRRLDPFAESTVDGIIAGTVSIQVLSGQFLSDKRVGTYVEVDMFGLPADTVRRKFRTKIIANNGLNPQFNEDPFVFKKVVLPELASIRLAAYEESGRLIGHRVLPVIGLCPGYRHVALRTEAGQPLPLATLFLLVVVKDFVPDGLSDFAEALANPIKYQSELEKRSEQLAVLIDGCEPDVPPVHEEEKAAPKPPPKRHQSSCPDLGTSIPLTTNTPNVHRTSVSVTIPETCSTDTPVKHDTDSEPPTPINSSTQAQSSFNEAIVVETLKQLMEYKVVKEKKLEMDKKLETLRKKQDKEKIRLTQSLDSDKSRAKFYTNKLVKRLSSKTIDLGLSTHDVGDIDSEEGGRPGLPRSQSERLLAVCKEHVNQERELKEKYQEAIFTSIEKLMKTSQTNQLKMLKLLLERETADVMRKLQAQRRDEVKALSKVHKDKDEMVRIKREVDTAMVERGVNERVRLTEVYERKKEDLERQHEQVRQSLEEEKKRFKVSLERDYETRCAKVAEEIAPSSSAHTQQSSALEQL